MSDKRSLVTFGTESNFPSITINDTTDYDNFMQSKASSYIQTRANEIREDFDDLKQIAEDTDLLNKLDKRFEPVTGRDYYLYESKQTGKFISFIEPHQWTPTTQPDRYHGWFVLTPDGTWVRITDPTPNVI